MTVSIKSVTKLLIIVPLLALASQAEAGDGLSIDRGAGTSAVIEAAGRLGDTFTLTAIPCGSYGDNCHYDAGAGVKLSITTLGGPHVTQLEASWNNSSKETTTASLSRFRSLCRAIVAAVKPDWDPIRVANYSRRLVIDHEIDDDHLDVEDAQGDISFYGSKNVPGIRDFPAEAFLQCGAVAAPR